jgi:hypothetical protein
VRPTELATRQPLAAAPQQVFAQTLSISGIAERPTVEETIPPNKHHETKQCDS